jgi:CheY-like chemotaxis protein
MSLAADLSVVIGSHVPGFGHTLRMALRGLGVRKVHLAIGTAELLEAITTAKPEVLLIYVDSGSTEDAGMQMLRFARRSETSPDRQIPIVVVSQSREMGTIQAVMNAGAHEYALYPASADQLLKKIQAARTSNRPFVDTREYIGPERRPAAISG